MMQPNGYLGGKELVILLIVYVVKIYMSYMMSCVGNDQEKAQSEKDSHSKNPGGKKSKLTIRYLYHENIVSRMSSYFPYRWPPSYLNLTKI